MERRNDFLDFTKGLLITLVVIGHILQFAVYQNASFWSDPLFKSIYMFHMPLMVGVSGFIAQRAIASTPPLKLVARRAVSYLLPILVWSTAFNLLLAVAFSHKPLAALPAAILSEMIGVHLWFLWALLGCVALTALAKLFGRYADIASGVFLLALLVAPEAGNLYLLKGEYAFFLIGHHAARTNALSTLFTSRSLGLTLGRLTLASGILTGLCYLLWHEETYIYVSRMSLAAGNLPNITLRFIASSIVSIFAMCVFFQAFNRLNGLLRRWLIEVGKASVTIYVLSIYLCLVILETSKTYFLPPASELIAGVSAVALGLALTAVCWYLGRLLSSNAVLAWLLFGKTQRPAYYFLLRIGPEWRAQVLR